MIQSEIEDFLSIYKTIYPQKKFVYMSTPITTGPRFIEWYQKFGKDYTDLSMYNYQHKINVIKMNEVDASARAEDFSIKLNEPVVNPAEFKVTLTQQEFQKFWTRFIADFASLVILSDGWALSKGCLNEFLAAHSYNVPLLNSKLYNINANYALLQIEEAIVSLKNLNLDYTLQEGILEKIKYEN